MAPAWRIQYDARHGYNLQYVYHTPQKQRQEQSLHITAEAESTSGGDLAGKYSH